MGGATLLLNLFARHPPPRLPPLRRIYAVGDIHGRLDLLEQITAAIADDDARRDPANTEIILLGDLIDRGPDSHGVIRHAMRTRPAFANVVALKGNHEAAALRALAGDLDMVDRWLGFGGRETLESFGVDARVLDSDDPEAVLAAAHRAIPGPVLVWLASLPLTFRSGDYLFVHAGIRPGIALEEQGEEDLLWIRGPFLNSAERHGVTVIHGHTVTKAPVIRANRIGIDTGAYASGRLTAVGIEGTRRWLLST